MVHRYDERSYHLIAYKQATLYDDEMKQKIARFNASYELRRLNICPEEGSWSSNPFVHFILLEIYLSDI